MPPIALGSKHQDLLKAYLEVSKGEKPDWASIASKAEFATAKYARDSFTIVKKKLLSTPNGDAINLSDSQMALLKSTVEVMKADTDWEKVARAANFKTAKYARDSWTIVRKKLSGDDAGSKDTPVRKDTPSRKETPARKRKKIEDVVDDEQVLADAEETPAKKPKKKKARKVKTEEVESEAEVNNYEAFEASSVQEQEVHKVEAEEVEPEAEVGHDESFEASSVQEQVDEQIKSEMQEYADAEAFDAGMFRMG